MDNNQLKLQEASKLLKEIEADKDDLDKRIKLLDKVNSLITDINANLDTSVKKQEKVSDSSTAESSNEKEHPASKVTISLPNAKEDSSVDIQNDEMDHQNSEVQKSAKHMPDKNTVHMSRKQYREMMDNK